MWARVSSLRRVFNPLFVFTTARAYWHRKFVTRFDPHTWKQTRSMLCNTLFEPVPLYSGRADCRRHKPCLSWSLEIKNEISVTFIIKLNVGTTWPSAKCQNRIRVFAGFHQFPSFGNPETTKPIATVSSLSVLFSRDIDGVSQVSLSSIGFRTSFSQRFPEMGHKSWVSRFQTGFWRFPHDQLRNRQKLNCKITASTRWWAQEDFKHIKVKN